MNPLVSLAVFSHTFEHNIHIRVIGMLILEFAHLFSPDGPHLDLIIEGTDTLRKLIVVFE